MKLCITTSTYRVLVNVYHTSTIRYTKGIRQENPLSPYLFILLSDLLSKHVEKEINEKQLQGIILKRGFPELHHIFFADDSLLFMQGSLENACHIKELIMKYCRISCQRVNESKSILVFNNGADQDRLNGIEDALQIPSTRDPMKYLGLPEVWGG